MKQLVLLAFMSAVVPLAVLMYQSGNALVDQSERARSLAREMLQSRRHTEQMLTQAEDIIRSARQYDIVNRHELRSRLLSQLDAFESLLQSPDFPAGADTLSGPLSPLLERLKAQSLAPESPRFAPDLLEQFLTETRQLSARVERAFDSRLALLEQQTRAEQRNTGWQALWLVAASAVLMVFFSGRINRPVQQLISRIRALGEGERSQGKALQGPVELAEVNEQLDWLAERLQSLEEDKVRFLRHISHELKTPLTTLREGADLLAEELAGPLTPNQHEIVSLLQQNSVSLQTLIEQLLDYNRLQQPGRLQRDKVHLQTLLERIMGPFKLQIEQKQLQTDITLNNVDHWYTDAQMLQRILSNLISNAVHYADNGGQISITGELRQHQLRLTVGNSGPEIPAQDLEQLFDPFYQGQNKRKGPLKGSGIGLSIAHQASDSLGASLGVVHNRDRWVEFALELPTLEP
ncbi:HAMP domain-containing histidine kinase [Marinobacterium sp. AK62]|uniref:histidine kinase n=1 Tax=Marinobacterium alkalitolerans TaxID=1542925 RepID=A0ABS3Z9H3_9GAMM|nr:HAMP domain-containing sensor histidine kinase [Marinobacterium alkalitolerans]MBP0047970.1 HAMP domain-containing histidine kinase [Marinobacterium alkalitolerans]